MRHWPLTQLTLTTPDLVLRVPDDDQLDDLAQVAADGVHPPGAVCFPQSWASGTPAETARNVVQDHWWARGDWSEDNWRLLLAVLHDGQVIGQQNLSARDFRITREARTGFWLGRRFQGHGFGTQMRAAALHLAFASLGAERVTPTAFADNTASRRASEKFGGASPSTSTPSKPTTASSPPNNGIPKPNSPPRSKGSPPAAICSALSPSRSPSTSYCTCEAHERCGVLLLLRFAGADTKHSPQQVRGVICTGRRLWHSVSRQRGFTLGHGPDNSNAGSRLAEKPS
ncbi:GNAT family N-acetyltransferase [Streptomyces prunicolor]|uniref:GNAT family N-acetyltransferase n=1 Tax=Streptomyces prunicolor TaxID=67348 RepID=UPI003716EC4C